MKMVESMDFVNGSGAVADGEDGFTIPKITADLMQFEASIFRYDPTTASTGSDTWLCELPGHMSVSNSSDH